MEVTLHTHSPIVTYLSNTLIIPSLKALLHSLLPLCHRSGLNPSSPLCGIFLHEPESALYAWECFNYLSRVLGVSGPPSRE